jgi:hypothetical protein
LVHTVRSSPSAFFLANPWGLKKQQWNVGIQAFQYQTKTSPYNYSLCYRSSNRGINLIIDPP